MYTCFPPLFAHAVPATWRAPFIFTSVILLRLQNPAQRTPPPETFLILTDWSPLGEPGPVTEPALHDHVFAPPDAN